MLNMLKRKHDQQRDPSVICILGMHRSGTSCLTGCLQECGLYLGEVVDAAPHNLKGNKESLVIRALNDELLAFNAGSWDKPPQSLTWNQSHRDQRTELLNQVDITEPWGFKDPRTLFTLPFWMEAIPQIKLVASFRNPVAVIKSLAKRDHMDKLEAETLWVKYNQRLLEWCQRHPITLINFDLAKSDYLRAVMNFAHENQLDERQSVDQFTFFAEELRHEPQNANAGSCGKIASQLYQQLVTLAQNK